MDDQNQSLPNQMKPDQVGDKPVAQDEEQKGEEKQEETPPGNQPSAEPVSDSSEKESADEETQPSAVKKSAGKVLLVEDDSPMVRMYSTKLVQDNFEVDSAGDGEEGLRKAREWQPDLIVLDLMIPKIGGMEVLEQLRAEAKTKNTPVIILSNLSQEDDIEKARQLGVKEFLIKANFTPSQVIGKIKEHLKN